MWEARIKNKNRGGGYADAVKALEAPPFPEELAYLHRWLLELYGRSGFSEHGVNPLTWECLESWSKMTLRNPSPLECDALMRLDGVMRHPEPPKGEES